MNVFDYFFERSKKLDKDFLLGPKEQISYKDLYQKSLQLAGYIKENTKKDEKILLLSSNNVFFLVVYLAIIKSERICVPLNPEIEARNLKYIIDQCKATFIFVEKKLINKHDLNGLTVIIDFTDFPESSDKNNGLETDFNNNSCAEIIFTSGSTGEPKGVMISHKNIIANTESILKYLKLNSDDIIEIVLPFYYCYGLSLLHTHLRVGGSIVLNNAFIFLGSVLNDLKKYKCTGFAGVPTHFQILLRKSDSFKNTTFPDLRYVTKAGGKLHDVFVKELMNAHPNIDYFAMYGQTEATARLSYLPLEFQISKMGSIGKGIPGVKLKVVNKKDEMVKPGMIGEIVAKGDNIMLGYLNDKVSTEKTIRNGWLHTGDLGTIDEDGFIYFKARSKEILKVNGERISPKEIEEIILSIPDVIDCTILSVKDELFGEAIKANVVIDKAKQNQITPKFIGEYCAKHLAIHKIPQIIDIQNNVVINSTGKKIKSEIK